ncbi:NAD(P)H-dependent oxidoreductase [Arenimonas sp.]|nr:NAD(P)H-dependent oxidoreductase [Candidatus Parcubacteria bacterium]
MTNIIDALHWRYATKTYDLTKKLDSTQVDMLIESVRLSPASFGLSTYKLIHVKNTETREKLKAAAWGQTQISDASDFLVFAAKTNLGEADINEFINDVSETRNVPVESLTGYADMIKGSVGSRSSEENIVWAAKQAYIGLGILLTAAALEKIDATPMEGFDSAQFDEILGLSALNLKSIVVVAIGYRSENDTYSSLAKVRQSKQNLMIEK